MAARLVRSKLIEQKDHNETIRDAIAYYEVEFTVKHLGLLLETDFYGNYAIVREIQSKTPAEEVGCIKIGHYLINVNGISLIDLSFKEIMYQLKNATLPITIRFLDPEVQSIQNVYHDIDLSNRDIYGFARTEQYIIEHRQHRRQNAKYKHENEKKWFQFIQQYDGIDGLDEKYNRSTFEMKQNIYNQLKSLVICGIPAAFRSSLWSILTNVHLYKSKYDEKHYQRLLMQKRSNSVVIDIDKDIYRTYPEHEYFQSDIGKEQLHRVLSAYASHNPRIGYCQSMNFIVGMMLLFLKEEETFWLFCVMMENYLPMENYTKSMVGTQIDQRVFQLLVEKELPQIHAKLTKAGVQIHLITIRWFLCAYVCTLPTNTALRVWDWFFLRGQEVLFDVAIAMLKIYEVAIMTTHGTGELFALVRDIGLNLHDEDSLMNVLRIMDEKENDDPKKNNENISVIEKLSKLARSPKFLSSTNIESKYKKNYKWEEIIQWREEIGPEIIQKEEEMKTMKRKSISNESI